MTLKPWWVALLCTFCFAALASTPIDSTYRAERFTSQLSMASGHLVWQGVRPGMSQQDVEGLLGISLALKTNDSGLGAFTHEAILVRDGVAVHLGFYIEGASSILTEIALGPSELTGNQVATLRESAKSKLKSLRDSGDDFALAAPGGEELDIQERVVRVQIGSDSD